MKKIKVEMTINDLGEKINNLNKRFDQKIDELSVKLSNKIDTLEISIDKKIDTLAEMTAREFTRQGNQIQSLRKDMDEGFKKVDERFETVNERFEDVNESLGKIRNDILNLDDRFVTKKEFNQFALKLSK